MQRRLHFIYYTTHCVHTSWKGRESPGRALSAVVIRWVRISLTIVLVVLRSAGKRVVLPVLFWDVASVRSDTKSSTSDVPEALLNSKSVCIMQSHAYKLYVVPQLKVYMLCQTDNSAMKGYWFLAMYSYRYVAIHVWLAIASTTSYSSYWTLPLICQLLSTSHTLSWTISICTRMEISVKTALEHLVMSTALTHVPFSWHCLTASPEEHCSNLIQPSHS